MQCRATCGEHDQSGLVGMLPSCGETRARPHLHDSSNLRLAGQPQRQKVPLGIAALHRVCSGGALLCRIHLLLNVCAFCAIALRRRALSQRKPGPSTQQEMSVLHTRSLAGSGRGARRATRTAGTAQQQAKKGLAGAPQGHLVGETCRRHSS